MAAGTKHYSADLKRDAVQMVGRLVAQGETEWAAMRKTADLLGVKTAETVRQWVRKEPAAGAGGGAAGVADSELVRTLKRQIAELERANEILKSASIFFAAELDRPRR